MRVLSHFASPAGFVLVLLLFFLLPFVSVSCDVPGYGTSGVNYTGTHLVSGADPVIPEDLQRVAEDPATPEELVDPPDAGVEVLAIVLAVLALAGVLTAFVSRLRLRLLSGTALAAATLVMTVITMVVAQSNLASALVDAVRQAGIEDQLQPSGDNPTTSAVLQPVDEVADELTRTEIGFWLMVVLLAIIILVTGTLGLIGHRLRPSPPDDDGVGLDALSPDDEPDLP